MFDVLKQGAAAYNLPSASFIVSASFGSEFYLDNQTLTTASKATVSTFGASNKQQLTFWLNNVDYPYTLIDGYTTASIFSSSVGVPAKVDVKFDGTQWSLDSFKRLALDSDPIVAQDPAFAGLGLVLDIDPTKYYTLKLTGSLTGTSINSMKSVVSDDLFLGMSHAPQWDRDGWNPNVPALLITGSALWSDPASQYLLEGLGTSTTFDALSCTASAWAAWTIFIVFKYNQVPAIEGGLLNFSTVPNLYPSVYIYADGTNFRASVYNDSLGSSDSAVLGTSDVNRHILDVSADGVGGISGSIDGGSVGTCIDARPKTVKTSVIGGGWLPGKVNDQMNGKIARVLVFNQNLSASDRTRVRMLLSTRYGF